MNLLFAGLALVEGVTPAPRPLEHGDGEHDDTDAPDPLDERPPPLDRPRERRLVDGHR